MRLYCHLTLHSLLHVHDAVPGADALQCIVWTSSHQHQYSHVDSPSVNSRGSRDRASSITDRENEALLAAVRQRELNLAIQASWAQQGGVQSVCAVGGHDDLKKEHNNVSYVSDSSGTSNKSSSM